MEPLCERVPTEPWQDDIGEDESNVVARSKLERLLGMSRDENFIACPSQDSPGRSPYLIVVLDQEYLFATAGRGAGSHRAARDLGARSDRKEDAQGGSAADGGLDGDGTAALTSNPVDRR